MFVFSQKKLENREYATANDFASDVRLVFENCYIYNNPTTDVVRMCKQVQVKMLFDEQNETKIIFSKKQSIRKYSKRNSANYRQNRRTKRAKALRRRRRQPREFAVRRKSRAPTTVCRPTKCLQKKVYVRTNKPYNNFNIFKVKLINLA